MVLVSYHKITNDDGSQEEGYTRDISHQHTVPHTLNPFSAQYSEHNHEAVHEIREVPSWEVPVRETVYVICAYTPTH